MMSLVTLIEYFAFKSIVNKNGPKSNVVKPQSDRFYFLFVLVTREISYYVRIEFPMRWYRFHYPYFTKSMRLPRKVYSTTSFFSVFYFIIHKNVANIEALSKYFYQERIFAQGSQVRES